MKKRKEKEIGKGINKFLKVRQNSLAFKFAKKSK